MFCTKYTGLKFWSNLAAGRHALITQHLKTTPTLHNNSQQDARLSRKKGGIARFQNRTHKSLHFRSNFFMVNCRERNLRIRNKVKKQQEYKIVSIFPFSTFLPICSSCYPFQCLKKNFCQFLGQKFKKLKN